jgi:hypothetical protein
MLRRRPGHPRPPLRFPPVVKKGTQAGHFRQLTKPQLHATVARWLCSSPAGRKVFPARTRSVPRLVYDAATDMYVFAREEAAGGVQEEAAPAAPEEAPRVEHAERTRLGQAGESGSTLRQRRRRPSPHLEPAATAPRGGDAALGPENIARV